MATTLADLLTTKTAADLKARLISLLQTIGYPTTDWESGSIDRTLIEIFAETLSDETALTPEIAGGGLADLAETDWLTLLAAQNYNKDRNPATSTIGNVKLTDSAGVGPVVISSVGQVKVIFPTGNIYYNITTGTVPLNGNVTLSFQSEGPNDSVAGKNYIDGSGTLSQLLTSIPGITVSNPASDFSTVELTGNSTGSVTPSRTNPVVTPTPSFVVLRIDSSGDLGVATYSYQLDGGALVSGGVVPASFAIPGRNITITFSNGAGTPNSFLVNDRFTFVAPGSWITQQGTDTERDDSLRSRIKDSWPSLSEAPTEDLYALFARTASSSVTTTRVAPSTITAGQVDIIIAGQAGGLAPAVITAVQNYINQRAPLTDRPVVQSATPVTITIAATVYVKVANLATAKTQAQTKIATSIANASIGGTLYLSQVTEDLMSCDGVFNVANVKINTVAADFVLSGTQVGSFTQNLSTTLGWIAS